MRYNKLPGTDLEVSEVCLGTMTFADKVDQEQATRAVAYAMDHGVNFFDTADIYPPFRSGLSETMLGEAVKPYRDRVYLATKVGGAFDRDPANKGLGRQHILDAVEGSLRRLQTDRIDIYYAHFPDPAVGGVELMETMNELIRAGKIRSYGISNYSAWQICEMVLNAKSLGLIPPAVSQSVYNLLTRGIENELVPFTKAYNMSVVAFNPLAGGMLTGKYQGDRMDPGTRFADQKGYYMRYWSVKNQQAVQELTDMAADLGMGIIELAYRWLLGSGNVKAILMGFSSQQQLEDNLRSAAMEKSVELPTKQIDEIWRDLTGNRFSYHY